MRVVHSVRDGVSEEKSENAPEEGFSMVKKVSSHVIRKYHRLRCTDDERGDQKI